MTNFRRPIRGYDRLADTLHSMHVSAHALTLLTRALRDQRRGSAQKPYHRLAGCVLGKAADQHGVTLQFPRSGNR